MVGFRSGRTITTFVTLATLLAIACAIAQADEASSTVKISPSDYDVYIAKQARNAKHHARPANTPAARSTRPSEISNLHPADVNPAQGGSAPNDTRYLGDLEYQGGAVIDSTVQHLVYVNLDGNTGCSTVATCWGDPGAFLSDLGKSQFIHVVDQYVGSTADNRYTVSNVPVHVNYSPTNKLLTDLDILTIVHAVATSQGAASGYHDVFHVFLVPGQDECLDLALTHCYSPDNPSTFFFCAYHGSVTFQDIGHVVYSVEPFQDVPGCSSRPGTPNGQLVDSTNNVLSHETFETLTDPDGTAWWNMLDVALFGEEIGDECSFAVFVPLGNGHSSVYFDPNDVTLNGNQYAAQPEYNNASHACSINP